MAKCTICNATIPDGKEICEDCSNKMDFNDEVYLDKLLASVTKNRNESYQHTEDVLDYESEVELTSDLESDSELEYEYEPITYTQEEIDKQNSKDDDWNLLNQTINKQPDKDVEAYGYDKEIPSEGALDEVESILMDDYGLVLAEMANTPNNDLESFMLVEEDLQQDAEEDLERDLVKDMEQEEYFNRLTMDDIMNSQDDIMTIPDSFVEEDMHNPLVNEEILNSLEDEVSEHYDEFNSLEHDSVAIEDEMEELEMIENESNELDEEAFLASLLNSEFKNEEVYESETIGTEEETIPTVDDELISAVEDEPISVVEEEIFEEDKTYESGLSSSNLEEMLIQEEPTVIDFDELTSNEVELDSELIELNKLLGEVTSQAEDFSLDKIMSTGVTTNEDEVEAKKVSTSDIFAESLSAVSSLDDLALETEFNNILPENNSTKAPEKTGFLKKLFSNIPVENPEEELLKQEEEEALAKERKQQKEEEKQRKAAEREELKAKKASLKEAKQKQLEDKKVKRKLAKEAMAAEYVPEGKINKAGATVVFLLAACVAVVIIQGSSFASYHLSIKSAEKDFNNARYDQAYQTLSGEKLKDKDVVVYDKLQTIMIVKKELNSYYNFKKIDMELEALNSVLKGIDRYKRYYADAKELEVDDELNTLKKKMLSILKEDYGLSEKESVALISIEDQKTYTDKLKSIVAKNVDPDKEDAKQVASKN